MNEYQAPLHRHEHDFRKIGELFARVQDFLTKPELAIYSQHTVNPPYTCNGTFRSLLEGAIVESEMKDGVVEVLIATNKQIINRFVRVSE